MTQSTRYELLEEIAVVHLDDGKVNAISSKLVQELSQHLERAENEARALLLVGRPGRFSAGYDLSEILGSPESARHLVSEGGKLFLRLFSSKLPIVAACTGHAIAGGSILLMSCDLRLGAQGDFKLGLNEVSLGMSPPLYLSGLAKQRLSPVWYSRAVTQSQIFSPEIATEVGLLDRTAPPEQLFQEALAEAKKLAALPRNAFASSKRQERQALADQLLAGLASDVAQLDVESLKR